MDGYATKLGLILFLVSTVLTVIVSTVLWDPELRWKILFLLALINTFLAAIALIQSSWSLQAWVLVCLGLLVGQWSFLKYIFMISIWTARGFAP